MVGGDATNAVMIDGATHSDWNGRYLGQDRAAGWSSLHCDGWDDIVEGMEGHRQIVNCLITLPTGRRLSGVYPHPCCS